MRICESKAIACALSLAMAISMTLPVGAFAAVDDSDQMQHEQKAVDIDNGVDVNADRAEGADKDASQDIDSGFAGDANEGGGSRRVLPRRAASLASSSLERMSVAKNPARAKQIASIRCPQARSSCLLRRLLPLLRARKPLLS